MSDTQSQQSTQNSKTLVALFAIIIISILSALFLPTIFTFFYVLPALIFVIIIYVSIERKSIAILVIGELFSVIFYPIIYSLFIHLFPTFIVILITIFLIRIIPYELSYIKKIFMFIFISFLLGINTSIFTLISNNYTVNEKITNILQLSEEESIQITGNSKEFPSSYRTHDFISFGADKISGYWVYPKIETSNISKLLQDQEIAYTLMTKLPKKIDIQYKETNNFYTLTIKVKETDKTLSSLSISDRLPYRSNIKTSELDSFQPRLEYLLRHNIWNGLIFYVWDELFHFYKIKQSNATLISEFLKRSIHSPDKQINWSDNVVELESRLLFESKLQKCYYKDYPFYKWEKAYADKSVKTVPEDSYIFENNNILYTTKEHADGKNKWHDHDFSYSNDKFVYAFNTFNRDYIRIIQFTKKGNFIRELHINMPKKSKNMIDSNVLQDFSKLNEKPSNNINKDKNNLVVSNWHPISHVSTTDKEIKFRVYSIYERPKQRNLCKYQYVAVTLN